MTDKSGGPAFPSAELNDDGSHHHSKLGMSLRDYMAAAALTGLLASHANPNATFPDAGDSFKANVEIAFKYADAMLAEREKS